MDIKKFINIVKENSVNVPEEVYNYIEELTPDDVGREVFDGGWILRFEGFTDECINDASERCTLPSDDPRHLSDFDDVYAEVYSQWRTEEGIAPIEENMAGDEDYPILYSIFYKGP